MLFSVRLPGPAVMRSSWGPWSGRDMAVWEEMRPTAEGMRHEGRHLTPCLFFPLQGHQHCSR